MNDDAAVSRIASAIGEPARARMLFCLMDGHARTSTELAIVADVSPSTASVHLHRLELSRLVKVMRQGKHRYYSLGGTDVAAVVEGLTVLAGAGHDEFVPKATGRLRTARSCYDHLAGTIGVALHDRFVKRGWLIETRAGLDVLYEISQAGIEEFGALGIDIEAARKLRRRMACGCLDWSERRYHLGGALGAAFLTLARKRKWVVSELDSRALRITDIGRRELERHFGISESI
jgi:DNA-binding transcriptional ArsR family regulator